VALPSLTVLASNAVVSDPVNGTLNPKAIPGAKVQQTISASNGAAGTPSADSTVFTFRVPAGMKLFVGDLGAAGSGPVLFVNGPVSSGLIYTYAASDDATSVTTPSTDSVSYSSDGVTFYEYANADADGCDAAITHVRISLSGTFAGKTGVTSPSLTLQMLMQVK
jgi:hypothetical protein